MASRYRVITVAGVMDVVSGDAGLDIVPVESDESTALDAMMEYAVETYVDDDAWRAGEYLPNVPKEIARRLADEWDGEIEVIEEGEPSEESDDDGVTF